MRKVLVVSDSPALRETVGIVLGDQFAVECRASGSAREGFDDTVSLIVADGDAVLPEGDIPVLTIGEYRPRASAGRRRTQALPANFDPLELRALAEALTRGPRPGLPRGPSPWLNPPFLPPAVAAVAGSALSCALPVCIWGESGTGKLRLARALHKDRGADYFFVLSAEELNAGEAPPSADAGERTFVVSGLERLDAAGQRRLLDLLAGDDAPVSATRVIALSRVDPSILTRQARLTRSLYYHLGVLILALPPLRQRPGDIPEMVEGITASLCESLGLAPVSFTEAALGRLQRYLWFGNLAELEAVIARSLVFAQRPRLDADDLRFGYGGLAPAAREAAATGTRSTAPAATVDLIIQELAHEFKNPMVTIKTFAHQVDHLSENGSGHADFAKLTNEAVERMDAALENLIQFTRFEQPLRQPTALGALISTALAGVHDAVAEKSLAVEAEATSAQVFVDPAQCGYALKNLLHAVVRELSQGDALALRATSGGGLAIEYPARAHSAARSLSHLVLGDGKEALPLGMAFARTLVERNGGQLDVRRDGDIARVSVALPLVGDGKEDHGEA